ncbi:MAG: VWA domain-containing protein [Chlamydiota bacterium]
MDFKELCFAHPLWLWGALMIPVVWTLFLVFQRKEETRHQLEKFIDSHLLPHLLLNSSNKKRSFWKGLLLWSLVWSCLTLALAGPRWDFREAETFSRDQSLVILLDLSESMNGEDVKPTRLIRAKQKIEDLINLSKGVKIGLIAFAADPHMIVPITEDKETLRHLLPSLGTDLVHIQGSRLSLAFDMASNMLEAEPGSNKALLVISDGGFEDASCIGVAKKLAEKGFVIHTMGIGSLEGAPLKNHQGNLIKKNGATIFSKLEKEKLKGLSEVGKGYYLEASYSDMDEVVILKGLEKHAEAQVNIGKKNRLWEERFYLLVILMLPVILWWFRRGYVLSVFLVFFISVFQTESGYALDYFKNSEELGKEALEEGDYKGAIENFKDPYRAGVAHYKAGNFAEAEKMFLLSSREEVDLQAAYNLGNSFAQQQKFKEAIAAYEDVLKKCKEHTNAKENLELVKAMMQEQESSQSDDSKDKDKESKEEQEGDDDKESKEDSSSPQEDQEEDLDSLDENKQEEEEKDTKSSKSQEDQDADLWLNQISNDPKAFLKNKFYIESKKNGTTKGVDPW